MPPLTRTTASPSKSALLLVPSSGESPELETYPWPLAYTSPTVPPSSTAISTVPVKLPKSPGSVPAGKPPHALVLLSIPRPEVSSHPLPAAKRLSTRPLPDTETDTREASIPSLIT